MRIKLAFLASALATLTLVSVANAQENNVVLYRLGSLLGATRPRSTPPCRGAATPCARST